MHTEQRHPTRICFVRLKRCSIVCAVFGYIWDKQRQCHTLTRTMTIIHQTNISMPYWRACVSVVFVYVYGCRHTKRNRNRHAYARTRMVVSVRLYAKTSYDTLTHSTAQHSARRIHTAGQKMFNRNGNDDWPTDRLTIIKYTHTHARTPSYIHSTPILNHFSCFSHLPSLGSCCLYASFTYVRTYGCLSICSGVHKLDFNPMRIVKFMTEIAR